MRTPPPPLADHDAVLRASAHALTTDADTLRDQAELTAVPAPPFEERERAAAFRARLPAVLGEAAALDAEGNVVALRAGFRDDAPLVVSAHLDTVFAAGTDVTVRTEDGVMRAPGISDDGRGLAVLLALARAMAAGEVRTRRPVLFAATVGEEGRGDLRGARYLVGEAGAGRGATAFVSVDGAGIRRIVSRGLGSRRLRVTVRGPGGHSWIDWGTVNPVHALAAAVAETAARPGWDQDAATLTVARQGGGTAINAIPAEAWVEVDVRSGDAAVLAEAEATFRDAVARAVAGAPAKGRGTLEAEITLLGDRPAGSTHPAEPLVVAAVEATRAVGIEPELEISSTDANAAMAVGIPAVTLGGGGKAGGVHTLGEWYTNKRGPEGVLRALWTVLAVAGVE